MQVTNNLKIKKGDDDVHEERMGPTESVKLGKPVGCWSVEQHF